jgi:hypothetical protein
MIDGTHLTNGESSCYSHLLMTSHLGGARQDNRIVPYEGCPISRFTCAQRDIVYSLLEAFNEYLPDGPRAHRMSLLRKWEDQTYFGWIGNFGPQDPYYFRIHSPVTFCEVRRGRFSKCR